MRKIVITIFLIVVIGCYLIYSKVLTNINFINLRLDEEVGLAFINSNMLLVMGEEDATLLILKNDNDIESLKKFKYDDLTVITLNNVDTNIQYDKKIILNNEYEIDEVTYSIKNNLIYINYEGSNACIYMGKTDNISNCQFVYFYNTNTSNVKLTDYNEMIFYHFKYPLSKYFLDTIHQEAINTYQLTDNKLTVLKIGEDDYDVIVINNN
jgi:hypothetical protein